MSDKELIDYKKIDKDLLKKAFDKYGNVDDKSLKVICDALDLKYEVMKYDYNKMEKVMLSMIAEMIKQGNKLKSSDDIYKYSKLFNHYFRKNFGKNTKTISGIFFSSHCRNIFGIKIGIPIGL